MMSREQQHAHRAAIARHHVSYGQQTRRFWAATTSAEQDMSEQLAQWHSSEAERLLNELHDDLADNIASRCAA